MNAAEIMATCVLAALALALAAAVIVVNVEHGRRERRRTVFGPEPEISRLERIKVQWETIWSQGRDPLWDERLGAWIAEPSELERVIKEQTDQMCGRGRDVALAASMLMAAGWSRETVFEKLGLVQSTADGTPCVMITQDEK